MTGGYECPDRPKLNITLLDDQAPVPTYLLYSAGATDKDVETMWNRFEEDDTIWLWENR
jgi:hypothetical protein